MNRCDKQQEALKAGHISVAQIARPPEVELVPVMTSVKATCSAVRQ